MFLKKWLTSLKPLETQDAFFEKLTYIKMPDGKQCYWEGERDFAPTGARISVAIDAPAPETPPSDAQREFFTWVERNFDQIRSRTTEQIRAEMESATRDAPLARGEFPVESFSIPVSTNFDEAEWEITFWAPWWPVPGALATVSMIGLQARPGVPMDD
jgi:hypothetical protein